MSLPVVVWYQGSLRLAAGTGRGAVDGRRLAWLPRLFFFPLIAMARIYRSA